MNAARKAASKPKFAFPSHQAIGPSGTGTGGGLTKLEYFAGQWLATFRLGQDGPVVTAEEIAKQCAEVAEAVVAELERRQ